VQLFSVLRNEYLYITRKQLPKVVAKQCDLSSNKQGGCRRKVVVSRKGAPALKTATSSYTCHQLLSILKTLKSLEGQAFS
jgi:hypothetical protein